MQNVPNASGRHPHQQAYHSSISAQSAPWAPQKQQSDSQGGFNPSYLNWRPKTSSDILIFLDLTKFKTQPCPNILPNSKNPLPPHNPKRCYYYHDAKKDRRRPLGVYTSEMCPEITSRANNYQCLSGGENCLKAHNRVEEFYHPEKYKSKFCQTYPKDMESCDYGEMCAFAHSEDEIAIELLHKMDPRNPDFYMFYFKTVWCPWSTEHDKETCVYAHNWQDLRRKPNLYDYHKDLCHNWQIEKYIKNYSDGCINEYRCSSSHGWKEQQYHPRNYKINPCKSFEKCKKHHCPYYHSEEDRRYPIDPNFILLPKNRGLTYNPHLQIYKDIFLNLLLTNPSRTREIGYNRQTQQQYQSFVSQSVYGCGPQSVPVLDPLIVQAYQQCQASLERERDHSQ